MSETTFESLVRPLANFKPEWSGQVWKFKSLISGNEFRWFDFVEECNNEKVLSSYNGYLEKANQYSRYEMFSEFLVYWLEQMLHLNALYDAEDAYNFYVLNNLNGAKKAGKVYKQAEMEYNKAYQDRMNKYKRI